MTMALITGDSDGCDHSGSCSGVAVVARGVVLEGPQLTPMSVRMTMQLQMLYTEQAVATEETLEKTEAIQQGFNMEPNQHWAPL